MVSDEETTLDPLHHPDLRRLGRELRRQMDETLDAELHAARAAARRRRTLRDVLLTAEDRQDEVVLGTGDGQVHRGAVAAVGADHVELLVAGIRHIVVLDKIVAVTVA